MFIDSAIQLLWGYRFPDCGIVNVLRLIGNISVFIPQVNFTAGPWYCMALLQTHLNQEKVSQLKFCRAKNLRANVSMHQTNSGKSPKFVFTPTFIFCSPICSNNCGVVFLRKYILVFEKWLFSFDHSNMQIFTLNITRVVWPHVTNVLDLRYFCERNPLFYHLNLIPCRYWSC